MAKYVDGFVIAVPKKNLSAYEKMAKEAGKVWVKHGALEYFECVGEDLNPNMGGMKFLKFPQAVKAKPDETVVFSFIMYKSRAHRDKVNSKVMEDLFMDKYEDKPMPFDMKRMAFGGFDVIVENRA